MSFEIMSRDCRDYPVGSLFVIRWGSEERALFYKNINELNHCLNSTEHPVFKTNKIYTNLELGSYSCNYLTSAEELGEIAQSLVGYG